MCEGKRYRDDAFEIIMEMVDMHELLGKYGYQPVRGSNIYRCMFHNDSNPSANVIKSGKNKNKFHCFTCNRSWSPVDFVCEIEGCKESKAIAILDDMFKLKLCDGVTDDDIVRLRLEREVLRKQNMRKRERQKKMLANILDELAVWKQIEKDTHLTRREYRLGEWRCSDAFFNALKMQEYLEWLYCVTAGLEPEDCIYNYINGDEYEEG